MKTTSSQIQKRNAFDQSSLIISLIPMIHLYTVCLYVSQPSLFENNYVMIESKEFKERLAYYRKEIRNQQIKSDRASKRIELISSQAISEIGLDFANDKPLSCQQLLIRFRDLLLQPFARQQMPSNALIRSIPIESHIFFWQKYMEHLRRFPFRSQSSTQLMSFLDEFKAKHSWETIQILPDYADTLAQLIQQFIPQMNDCSRQGLAQWISGIQRIQLIVLLVNSIQEFPLPKKWNKLYLLLQEGLSSEIFQRQAAAANALTEIVKYANASEISMLLQLHPQLYQKTLILLQDNLKDINAIHFWLPLFYLLQASSSHMIELSRSGLINLCGKLISSNLQKNIFGGLSILLIFSQCHSPEVVDLLSIDQQLSDSKMWLSVCLQNKIYSHKNLEIRKLFFEIIRNGLMSWGEQQFNEVYQKIQLASVNFLDAIILILQQDDGEEQLLCSCLECLLGLLMRRKAEVVFEMQSKGVIKLVASLSMKGSERRKDVCQTVLQVLSSMTIISE